MKRKDVKVGDRVKVIYNDNGSRNYVGDIYTVYKINLSKSHPYLMKELNVSFSDEEIELYEAWRNGTESKNKGEISMNDKYYIVLKDCPLWYKGAILKKNSEGYYSAISDLWMTVEDTENAYEMAEIVENSSEWFERVYNVGRGDKQVFATKDKARELSSSLFEVKK